MMRLLVWLGSVAAAVLAAAPASAQSSGDEARFYQCSYRLDGTTHWAAVETRVPYAALTEQWKAFVKGKEGTSAFCFSRFRKDDPPYSSLDEIEAISMRTADARKVSWSPKAIAAPVAAKRTATESTTAPAAVDPAAKARAARDAEFDAKMRQFNEGVAAHKAAVEQYQKDRQAFEDSKVANASAAKAAEEEAAKRQAAYEAEVQRVRDLERKQQEDYQALLRAQKPNPN